MVLELYEDDAKLLVGNVKKLPKSVKDSDAYLGLDRSAKEFLSTCPLIGSLRQPAMRERHWDELMDVTKKEFKIPSKTPDFRLRDLLVAGERDVLHDARISAREPHAPCVWSLRRSSGRRREGCS